MDLLPSGLPRAFIRSVHESTAQNVEAMGAAFGVAHENDGYLVRRIVIPDQRATFDLIDFK